MAGRRANFRCTILDRGGSIDRRIFNFRANVKQRFVGRSTSAVEETAWYINKSATRETLRILILIDFREFDKYSSDDVR